VLLANIAFAESDEITELRKKAEAGDGVAQYKLGASCVAHKDKAAALGWFKKAAEQGLPQAQYELARIYNTTGNEGAVAHEWMRKSAEQGYAPAQCGWGGHLGLFSSEGHEWMRKSAEQGYAMAQWMLGSIYEGGWGLPEDKEAAVKWYRKAADQGCAEAQNDLGNMYAKGEGVSVDDAEAIKWYRKAADQGYAEAEMNLGRFYDQGYGVPEDTNAARRWLYKAAIQGNERGALGLALLYMHGRGGATDEVEALAWLYVAESAENEPKSASKLISYFELHDLRSSDVTRAKERHLELAAEIDANQSRRMEFKSLVTTFVPSAATMSSGDENPKASGSGTIVSTQGYVLTAAHVVTGATSIKIVTSQGIVSAKVLRVDETNDIAILKIDTGSFTPLPVAPSRHVRLGQAVATIGFPNVEIQGFSPKVTRGEISSLSGVADDPRSWQVSVPVQPGNSGGPLLDEYGNLIGVVQAKLGLKAAEATGDMPQNVNYAVKSAYALALLEPYLCDNAPEPNQPSQKPSFEDMVAKAQQSVVLILVY